MRKFLYLLAFSSFVFTSCEKDDVLPLAYEHKMETISTDTIWRAANNPHLVKSFVKITSGTLTIEPGVIVKFDADAFIEIGGINAKLLAVGTAQNPIVFTSNSSSPQPGDWRYIQFKQGAIDSKLEFCNIEYGGKSTTTGMVDISDNALVSFNNCSLSKSLYYPIVADDGNGFVQFNSNAITSSTTHAMNLHGRNVRTIGEGNTFSTPSNFGVLVTDNGAGYVYITQSATWRKVNVPYFIEKELIVKGGASLTIEPGCTLKFMSGKGIQVGYNNENGKLIAKGTATDSIFFTSASATPQPGDWGSIEFKTGAIDSELEYCKVTFGGTSTTSGMIDVIGSAIVSIKNCKISNSKNIAIEAEDNGNGFQAFQNNKVIAATGKHALRVRGKHIGTIGEGNVFTSDNYFGILVTGSGTNYIYIDANDTWRKHNVDYFVEDDIHIRNESTLTLNPGVTLRFYNAKKLQVGTSSNGKGRIVARGSLSNPINFTSASASPQKGDWRGIEFTANALADCEMAYCNVSYGGSSKANVDIYFCGNGNPIIENSNISQSSNWGIYKRKSGVNVWATPMLNNNSYSNNTSGEVGQDS